MPEESEALRLAEQRTHDLEQGAYARGVAAAELAARLERIEARSNAQETHLKQINGSQAEAVVELRDIKQQLVSIATDLAKRDKDVVVRSEQRLTKRQSVIAVLMALFAFGSLLILVIQAITGH